MKGYVSPKSYINKTNVEKLLTSLTPDFVGLGNQTFTSCNEKLDAPFSKQELSKSIKNRNTTPGTDNISYSMLKHLPDNAKDILLHIFNQCFNRGFVLKQWRQINIVPIPKYSQNAAEPTKLRPISMISCICKTFHYMILNRIEWYLEHNKVFSDCTVGFRKCRSSLDSLSNLTSRIQAGFSEGHCTIGCFIDIENAYNNIE